MTRFCFMFPNAVTMLGTCLVPRYMILLDFCKIDGKLRPPLSPLLLHPRIKDRKKARFSTRAASSLLSGEKFGFSVQDCSWDYAM